MGTGMVELKMNISKLKDVMPVFKDKDNEGVVNEEMKTLFSIRIVSIFNLRNNFAQ